MIKYGRPQSLFVILRKQPSLRVPVLAQTSDVSEGAVRNDLNALENEGKPMRVYGGAVLNDQDQFLNNFFMRRYKHNIAVKTAIAREAAPLIKNVDAILLDVSSTAYYLARALSERNKLREVSSNTGLENDAKFFCRAQWVQRI